MSKVAASIRVDLEQAVASAEGEAEDAAGGVNCSILLVDQVGYDPNSRCSRRGASPGIRRAGPGRGGTELR